MKQYRQFEPVLIADFETRHWQHPVHRHNHYEIIYISKGTGVHHINNSHLTYSAGQVFFVGPEDEHWFDIHQTTRFVYLKFTDAFLHQQDAGFLRGLQILEYLIKRRDLHLSGFRFTGKDQEIIDKVFGVITLLKDEQKDNTSLIWLQLVAVAGILQRNLPEIRSVKGQTKNMQSIYCYIHRFIYSPEKLKASVLASEFNTTEEYIGRYFKKHAGITLRDYVQEYRSALIKKRLKSSDYSLKQIAVEFGLADQSHVSKLLKRAKQSVS